MSQHVDHTCDESDGQWLPLTEYSVRSGVSTSTIRRKIKSNTIPYRLENGRYMIFYSGGKAPAPQMVTPPATGPVGAEKAPTPPPRMATASVRTTSSDAVVPLIDRSVKMMSDAFERTIQEKDERISLLENQNQELRDRLEELRILVQALEERYNVRY